MPDFIDWIMLISWNGFSEPDGSVLANGGPTEKTVSDQGVMRIDHCIPTQYVSKSDNRADGALPSRPLERLASLTTASSTRSDR